MSAPLGRYFLDTRRGAGEDGRKPVADIPDNEKARPARAVLPFRQVRAPQGTVAGAPGTAGLS